MDMKSYDISEHPELLFVPYRPLSGKNLRDFKNTFLFTLDNLQVCFYMEFMIFFPIWTTSDNRNSVQAVSSGDFLISLGCHSSERKVRFEK